MRHTCHPNAEKLLRAASAVAQAHEDLEALVGRGCERLRDLIAFIADPAQRATVDQFLRDLLAAELAYRLARNEALDA